MLHPTSIILLPLVVFVFIVLDTSKAKPNLVEKLHYPEAKEVMPKLNRESHYMIRSASGGTNKQAAIEDALLAVLEAHRKAHNLAKRKDCAGNILPNDNFPDLIGSIVNDCHRSVPIADLGEYSKFNTLSVLNPNIDELVEFVSRMQQCFKRKTAEIQSEFVKDTELMNTCLAKKS